MASIEKVKILVVGDSGVGKSSLVHLICHNENIANPAWTIGCNVEVKLHEYKEGTPSQKTYFVELWDIGGSSSHRNSRSVFYNSLHGIVLVHDLTNKKSQQNLKKWLSGVLCKEEKMKGQSGLPIGRGVPGALSRSAKCDGLHRYGESYASNREYEYDPEQFVDRQMPVLVIGTKLDSAQRVLSPGRTSGSSSFADECGAEEIFVDCQKWKSLAPASSNAVKLSRFFDKVIERRYHSQTSSQVSAILDRRRLAPSPPKSPFVDKLTHWD